MWVWPFHHLQYCFEPLRAHFDAHALTYRNTSTRLEPRRSNKLWKWTIQRKASCCRGREKAASEPKALLFFLFFSRGPLSPFCLFLLLCLEPRSIHLLNCALRLAIALQTSTETRSLELHLSVIGRTAGTFEGGISQRNTPHNAIVSQNKQQRAVLRAR